MSESSSRLSLPYLQPSQAQKHVTHNEALRRLDLLVQAVAADRDRGAPPAASEGDCHIVGSGATGAWAGHDGEIALFSDNAWSFTPARPGWQVHVLSEGATLVFDGTGWILPRPPLDNLPGLGLNTVADATNRLSVSAPASLLSHEGAGHQLKINKAGMSDTASLLFQTGWSGRAEMGTAGSDAFVIKVSGDGATWQTGLEIDPDTGEISAPAGLQATAIGGGAVQQSVDDATPGRLLAVGAFGLGGAGPDIGDMNAAPPAGFHSYVPTSSNGPDGAEEGQVLIGHGAAPGHEAQLFLATTPDGRHGQAALRTRRDTPWPGDVMDRSDPAAWNWLYGQNNIVGPVSQAGGHPTGAVIETASTAEGSYVRWADGTQICTRTVALDALDVSTPIGALFHSPPVALAFPAGFAGNPWYCSATVVGTDNAALRATLLGAQPDTGDAAAAGEWGALRILGAASVSCAPGEMTTVRLFAIGRWF